MMIKIQWEIRQVPEPPDTSGMRIAAEQAVQQEGIRLPCVVHVCLCDDTFIAGINREFRGIPSATDVLSFPSVSWPDGKTAGECQSLLQQEYDDDACAYFMGDIFISVPHMIRQAKEYGHSVLREGCYLLVHGLCHLMGYDHISDEDRAKMRSMEEKILSAAGVSRDDDVHVSDETLLKMAESAALASYSPYSSYPVGAALLSADGRVFTGCNIENASYGLTVCAERVALFKAVSEGATVFDSIAVSARTTPRPCGACRQALYEFAPDLRILVPRNHHIEVMNLRELLPDSFGPENLKQE